MPPDVRPQVPSALDTITLGGGCFWCTEAVYEQVDGVTAVESGYCNGHVVSPTYEQVWATTRARSTARASTSLRPSRSVWPAKCSPKPMPPTAGAW
jgi:hypothetical protein